MTIKYFDAPGRFLCDMTVVGNEYDGVAHRMQLVKQVY